MTKREISFDEIPGVIREAQKQLICKKPEKFASLSPQGLGLPFPAAHEVNTGIESMLSYYFEPLFDEKVFNEKEVAFASVIYNFDKTRKRAAIKRVNFRIYGDDKNTYMEIAAGITYDASAYMWSDDNKMVLAPGMEPDWDLEKTPKWVVIRLDGREAFHWVSGKDSPIVLKEAFDTEECTVRGLLGLFTEMYDFGMYESAVIWKTTAAKFFQKFADKLNAQPPEKEKNDSGEDDEEEYGEYPASLRKYAKLINDEKYKIEPAVLAQVMRELSRWCRAKEKAEQYVEGSEEYMRELLKENLPNLAFLGEAGSGKSELAKRLAKNVLGAEFLRITGAQLKGNFVGQTKSAVVEQFKILIERAEADIQCKPAVLFIDEAYNLFNNQDNFGAEAIEILLTAMEGGKRPLRAKAPRYNKDDELMEVWLNENVAVWLGGYEKDMRKALSVNRGMYRRVRTVTLPAPETEALWDIFQKSLMEQGNELLGEEIRNANRELCENRKEYICEYFNWGRSKTYAEFFGNYSGAEKLAKEIVQSTLIKGMPLDKLNRDLEDIVERQKAEILTQYQQVIEEKYERLPFIVSTDVKETFDAYIGADGAKEKLRQVIDIFCSPELYPACDPPRGALLMGPPGSGKTYLARCMAGELRKAVRDMSLKKDVAFIKVAATELRTEELVKALFSASEGYDYVVIFIDEIDAVGKRRERLSNQTVLIQLLNELDGFERKSNLFVLAATNAPEALDPALRRPGRFDMDIEVGYPNDEDRRRMVRHYIGLNTPSGDLISEIVKRFRGYSPVQIKTILNEARILYCDCEQKIPGEDAVKVWFVHRAVRSGKKIKEGMKRVTLKDGTDVLISAAGKLNEDLFLMDFQEVIARRMMGERTGLDRNAKELSRERNDSGLFATAVHETGHALMSVLLGCRIEKITILERGNVLGYVSSDLDAELVTKQDYLNKLDICFGGRAAEEIVYGPDQVSSKASGDIRNASSLARYMIMQLGMNEKVGPVALETASGRYLGGGNQMMCTESAMAMAEDEVRKLLKERYSAALETLRPYGELLKKLADHVYEKEEVSGEKFRKLVEEMKNN